MKTEPTNDGGAQARVKRAERNQVELRFSSLNQMIPVDHRVRLVWAYVEGLDFSALYKEIKAVEGHVGRDAVDPKILMALWLFATIEGVSSARELARLCERDVAFLWICGGVSVNYHLLSDFRTGHGEFLDELLTNSIAALMHRQIVSLETVAQDGMRVRANAGTSSFRREPTLRECRERAAAHLKELRESAKNEDDSDPPAPRRTASRDRAARERLERVEQALKDVKEVAQQKESEEKGAGQKARASTTDSEARTMKMPNGGFSPAYNVQFATDAKSRMIVSVGVSNNGSDASQMAPRHEDIHQRYGKYPEKYLVDGGFTTKNDVTTLEKCGTQVFGPIPQARSMLAKGSDPYARQNRDSDEMFAFRQRMKTEEAKTIYQLRCSVAEFPNAECRNRGLQRFLIRGLKKVNAVALWHAITFNLMRMLTMNCVTAT
jgi:transposase